MANENGLSKGRWAGKTKEEISAHRKLMSNAYWGKVTQEQKNAHAQRARDGRAAKKLAKLSENSQH